MMGGNPRSLDSNSAIISDELYTHPIKNSW